MILKCLIPFPVSLETSKVLWLIMSNFCNRGIWSCTQKNQWVDRAWLTDWYIWTGGNWRIRKRKSQIQDCLGASPLVFCLLFWFTNVSENCQFSCWCCLNIFALDLDFPCIMYQTSLQTSLFCTNSRLQGLQSITTKFLRASISRILFYILPVKDTCTRDRKQKRTRNHYCFWAALTRYLGYGRCQR